MGVGVVGFRERETRKMVYLRVRKKDHLINFLLPIFDKYPLFSNKQYDYLRLKSILLSNLVLYDEIAEYNRPNESLNSVDSILNAPYFSAWLIGFIEAEGCFSIYKLNKNDEYYIGSFDISQTNSNILISAIRKYLSLTPNIYLDKTNNFKLKATSIRSLENVIKFINKAPVKLLGKKNSNIYFELKSFALYLDTLKKLTYQINTKLGEIMI